MDLDQLCELISSVNCSCIQPFLAECVPENKMAAVMQVFVNEIEKVAISIALQRRRIDFDPDQCPVNPVNPENSQLTGNLRICDSAQLVNSGTGSHQGAEIALTLILAIFSQKWI